ncbi:hypothetical protein [Deinococcus humi]|uniref:Uncharacterized protein n=1 Tax=Deinococcus humi TaxID=662880 RepID=A0A7W8K004_9DEIO|nr:hypothetical protein [Deinococcus humi]MBB5366352.1 hypothetical protein [Deinococcus humi]GGO41411.1 hypothetical protein GCM10008949_52190 [Deinococcus humi]
MKTAASVEQFAISLKNGKIGPFRMQTTRDEIETQLCDQDLWRNEDGSLGGDGLEMFFDETSSLLVRVKVRFYQWAPEQAWTKVLNIVWLDWLAQASLLEVEKGLESMEVGFRSIVYTDESKGVLTLKGGTSVLVVFGQEGTIDSLHLDFSPRYNELVLMKSMTSYRV